MSRRLVVAAALSLAGPRLALTGTVRKRSMGVRWLTSAEARCARWCARGGRGRDHTAVVAAGRALPRNEFGVPVVTSPSGVVYEVYYDPTSKQVYFCSPESRVTQWEDPRLGDPAPWWRRLLGGGEKQKEPSS